MSSRYNDFLKSEKVKTFFNLLKVKKPVIREMLAEFLGTLILTSFGTGSVAQSVLSRGASGSFLSINWGFGIGVAMAVYASGNISGGHVNPAISVMFSVFGRLPWWKLPLYIFAQMFGGFMAGAIVYSAYIDAIKAYDEGKFIVYGVNATAGIFATYPQSFVSISTGFWNEVIGTAWLSCLLLVVTDRKNNKVTDGLTPVLIGFILMAIGLAYGFNTGYALNPARDFGPRLFTYTAGYGSGVFTEPNGMFWWWVPIVAPIVGALLGGFMYKLLIGNHFPSNNKRPSKCVDEDNEL